MEEKMIDSYGEVQPIKHSYKEIVKNAIGSEK